MLKYAIFIALIGSSYNITAQNWPQWRGPEANGIAENGDYPTNFSIPDDLVWKYELPGAGGSTPIVWQDCIIITSGIGEGDEGKNGVLCFDWNGKLIWQVELDQQIPGKHPRGTGSNPSAVTDGERIFVLFKTTTLAALDFDGKVLWKTNLQQQYGEITFWWDFGTSPVLSGDNLIVSIMHEGESYILALNQATGEEVWKTDRTYECSPETAQSYTTPLVLEDGNESTIVVWGANHLTGHDAETGVLKWSYDGFNPQKKQYWRVIASPAISGDTAVVPFGRGRRMAAMKIPAEGELNEQDWLWQRSGIGTDVSTPIVKDGNIYVLSFNGKLWCIDLETGENIWETKLPAVKGMFYSSPVLVDDLLYMVNEEGAFYVCKIKSDGIDLINQLKFEDNFVATPVLVQNKLLMRGTKFLYCIGK